jgi:hypothetical protein
MTDRTFEISFPERRRVQHLFEFEVHLLVDTAAFYGLKVRAPDANAAVRAACHQVPESINLDETPWCVLGCVKLHREDALCDVTDETISVYGHQG